MPKDDAALITDRDYLRTSQYRTDGNLAARQSIYRFQRPPVDLPAAVLGLAELTGAETVADVGCGNGIYLAELSRRGHRGPVIGVDLSTGMLQAARAKVSGTLDAGGTGDPASTGGQIGFAAGDAAALPLPDGAVDVALAPHMLYHVPDRLAAARELRRVTSGGGQLLVVLNGLEHLAELRDLVTGAAAEIGLADVVWADNGGITGGLSLDDGEEMLAGVFGTVRRHEFDAELEVPGPEPVLEYVASMRYPQNMDEPERLVAAAARLLRPDAGGVVRIRTRVGCLVCR
jgi:SAM-dependent methyltransferase